METAECSTASWQRIPSYIDNDVTTKAQLVVSQSYDEHQGTDEVSRRNAMLRSICVAMQIERNAWKERLQDAFHTINKQHKSTLVIDDYLQEIANRVGMQADEEVSHLHRVSAITQFIKQYLDTVTIQLQHSQSMYASAAESLDEINLQVKQYEQEIAKLKEEMKCTSSNISRLRAELSACKRQLQIAKLHLHTHAHKQHISDTQLRSTDDKQASRVARLGNLVDIEMTTDSSKSSQVYLNVHTKNPVPTCHKDDTVKAVVRCFRCKHFFRRGENNNRDCLFHSQGKQMKEMCDSAGRLLKPSYVWSCCKKAADAPGCTYGYHY